MAFVLISEGMEMMFDDIYFMRYCHKEMKESILSLRLVSET